MLTGSSALCSGKLIVQHKQAALVNVYIADFNLVFLVCDLNFLREQYDPLPTDVSHQAGLLFYKPESHRLAGHSHLLLARMFLPSISILSSTVASTASYVSKFSKSITVLHETGYLTLHSHCSYHDEGGL